MFSFLTDLEVNLVVGVVSAIAGVVFSTKITDFFQGIPAELRSALTSVKNDALAKVSAAKSSAISEVTGVVAKAPLPAAAPAPVVLVPAAAAPVAAAAAPAPAPAPAAV